MDQNYDIDSKVADVYRNLTRKCLSVRIAGLVRAHRTILSMRRVDFVVHESGRGRVIETGRKNVHAFARGIVDDYPLAALKVMQDNVERGRCDLWQRVTYNPRKYSTFVTVEGELPVWRARNVLICDNGHVWAAGIEYMGA